MTPTPETPAGGLTGFEVDDDYRPIEREADALGRCGTLRFGGPCWLMPGHRGPHHGYRDDVDAVVAAAVVQARAEDRAHIERLDADYQRLAREANDDSREIERLNTLLRAVGKACPTCHGSGRHKTRDQSCNVCGWLRAALTATEDGDRP